MKILCFDTTSGKSMWLALPQGTLEFAEVHHETAPVTAISLLDTEYPVSPKTEEGLHLAEAVAKRAAAAVEKYLGTVVFTSFTEVSHSHYHRVEAAYRKAHPVAPTAGQA